MGLLYAYELSQHFPDPADYIRRLDDLLMYLARYAHLDALRLEHEPTRKLMAWAQSIEALLEAENARNQEPR